MQKTFFFNITIGTFHILPQERWVFVQQLGLNDREFIAACSAADSIDDQVNAALIEELRKLTASQSAIFSTIRQPSLHAYEATRTACLPVSDVLSGSSSRLDTRLQDHHGETSSRLTSQSMENK